MDIAQSTIRPAAVVAIVVLGSYGCATSYRNMNFAGGVESIPLRPDMEMVVAEGNGFTSSSRLQQFVLLKSAQDCLAGRFDKFSIMSARNHLHGRTRNIPISNVTGNSDADTIGGVPDFDPYVKIPVIGFDATVVVRFFKGPTPPFPATASNWSNPMDAHKIAHYLGPRLTTMKTGDWVEASAAVNTIARPSGALALSLRGDVAPTLELSQGTGTLKPLPPAQARELPPSRPAVASAGDGYFAVQIGTFKLQRDANATWQIISRKDPFLGRYRPRVTPLAVGGSDTWYRLRLGGFPGRNEAAALCDRLKAGGDDCFVVQSIAKVHRLQRIGQASPVATPVSH
ncbi:MAG: SPOR domain-containing protein [Rhizomicrobium sp.]